MSRLRLTAFLGSLLASTIVLTLVVGPTFSAIPNPTNKKFYGCMNKKTRVVKMLNYPKVKTCPKRHKLIKWNAKGNPGAAGVPGAAGPADWNAIGNKPPGFADGTDNVGSPGYVTATVPCANPIAAGGEYVIFDNLPRNMVHDFQVVPTNNLDLLYIVRVEMVHQGDDKLSAWVRVDDANNTGSGTCNIRRISFTAGISIANAKKQLKKVEVSYAKKGLKKKRR